MFNLAAEKGVMGESDQRREDCMRSQKTFTSTE